MAAPSAAPIAQAAPFSASYNAAPPATMGAGTDIVVDDSEVSRQHCALEVHGAKVLLVDLGSTNGTFVGGQRIEASEIEHLGEFRIGGTTFMLTAFDSM